MPRKTKRFADVLEHYLAQLRKLSRHPDASDELSFRPVFQRFLEGASKALTSEARATFITEPKRKAFGVPDFKVTEGHSQVGYIETKALGTDLDSVMETEQMRRYRQLPNMILTNYLEFRLFQDGNQSQQAVLCSSAELESDGPIERLTVEPLRALLASFLSRVLPGVGTAEGLAEEMAWRTHLMRDAILKCKNREGQFSDELRRLFDALKLVLIHDLTPEQFADMYAQTVAYGLFAARHQSVQPGRLDTLTNGFSLSSAARLVPRANPLLRSLFKQLADEDMLDPGWMWHAADIADLLSASDMRRIAQDMARKVGREDPVIHFYETFLKKYDPKIREMRGVYYTPEPVVSYIVRSVDTLLKERFGRPDGLADESVMILDPAVGTGTFLTGVIKHLHGVIVGRGQKGTWADFVRGNLLPRLFGFEVLMAPYSIAHLKVGMLLEELGYRFEDHERLHVYLTNTLEQAAQVSNLLAVGFAKTLLEEGRAAGEIKAEKPIMVIIGNPPYSGHSMNPSRVKVNGKWQRTWIGELIEDYRRVDGKPLRERNPKWIQDDYVKFIRFAQWRIAQTGHGIVSMITNHGYLDNPTFRGMRQSLMGAFDQIYVLDLHGNVKKKEVAPDGTKDENVFDIQQGTSISVFVNTPGETRTSGAVRHAQLWGERDKKHNWLEAHQVGSTAWTHLSPRKPSYWFAVKDNELEAEHKTGWRITDIMPVNSVGIVTARDRLTFQYTKSEMLKKVELFSRMQAHEARQRFDLGPDVRDWRVRWAQEDVLESGVKQDLIIPVLYRPFDVRYTYYTGRCRGFICMPRKEVMQHMFGADNLAMCFHKRMEMQGGYAHFLCSDYPVEHCAVSIKTTDYLAPLYLYPTDDDSRFDRSFAVREYKSAVLKSAAANGWDSRRVVDEAEEVISRLYPDGSYERWPNLDPFFIDDIRKRMRLSFLPDGRGDLTSTFGPEDVFAYIYGVFHSPTYRKRYAEFLKIDFPGVPLTSNAALFRALCEKGHGLVDLHLMRDERLRDSSFWGTAYPVPGNHEVTCVDYRLPEETAGSDTAQSAIPNPQSPIDLGRVYINKKQPKKGIEAQYFDGIPRDVWEFRIGGYQVLDHWLRERKRHKRSLTLEDIEHYQKVVAVLRETIRLMAELDAEIEGHGGWPIS